MTTPQDKYREAWTNADSYKILRGVGAEVRREYLRRLYRGEITFAEFCAYANDDDILARDGKPCAHYLKSTTARRIIAAALRVPVNEASVILRKHNIESKMPLREILNGRDVFITVSSIIANYLMEEAEDKNLEAPAGYPWRGSLIVRLLSMERRNWPQELQDIISREQEQQLLRTYEFRKKVADADRMVEGARHGVQDMNDEWMIDDDENDDGATASQNNDAISDDQSTIVDDMFDNMFGF